MAVIITQVFPTEVSGTYYVSSSKGKNPLGKLLSCYSNLRHSLAEVGLIDRESRRSLSNTLPIEPFQQDANVFDAQNVIESEEWNEDQLFEAWEFTHKKRQKDLKSNISTSEYMGRYPSLKQPRGFKLVSFFVQQIAKKTHFEKYLASARCKPEVSFVIGRKLSGTLFFDRSEGDIKSEKFERRTHGNEFDAKV